MLLRIHMNRDVGLLLAVPQKSTINQLCADAISHDVCDGGRCDAEMSPNRIKHAEGQRSTGRIGVA